MAPRARSGAGPHRPWHWDDDDRLREWWGFRDVVVIAKRLNRTPVAISQRGKQLGLKSPAVGLREAARRLGVSTTWVKAACRELGWQSARAVRTDPRQLELTHKWALSPFQMDQLFRLRARRPRAKEPTGARTPRAAWGTGIKPPCCLGCGQIELPHFAKGKCKSCYVRLWRWWDRRLENPNARVRRSKSAEQHVKELK